LARIGFVHRGILSRSLSFWAGIFWALTAIAVPTMVRFAIPPFADRLPYLTFFPAVLVAAIFLGWRWGLFVVVGCAVAADYFFMRPVFRWSMSAENLLGTVFFFISAGLIVATAEMLRVAVRELDGNTTRERALNAELQHRVKNNLAVVQALARQTVKHTADPTEFYPAFTERLMALAAAHDVLCTGDWEDCRLPDLATAALKPFEPREAITLDGPDCSLPPVACVPMVLALHELGTNAVKYGALSVPSGRVALNWRVDARVAVFHWQESGGPLVEAPKRRGLGSRLLTKQSGLDEVDLRFDAEGVSCTIRVAGAKLADG
jgi:two-component sensor histidine kinase